MSNFCYITDAVRAIIILMTQGDMGEAYNVCHDEETRSIASIANLVLACHVGAIKFLSSLIYLKMCPPLAMRLQFICF